MSSPSGPGTGSEEERLALALADAGLRPRATPQLVLSWSNDAWLVEDERLGSVVLRICWRGDRARLLREAALGAALPPAARYPAVLGAGTVPQAALTWALTRRLAGESLAKGWPALDGPGRDAAGRAVAEVLRALHRFRPPADLAARLRPTPLSTRPDVDEVVGRAMSPWPDGVRVLLAAAPRWGLVPPLLTEVRRLLERDGPLGPDVDARSATVVHGDLHLENLWSEQGRVTGLLDLEWVRPAPPWVDLARLADEADVDAWEGPRGHAELLAGLRRWYPELFAVDRLAVRLRLVRVAYQLRQLATWPAPAPLEGGAEGSDPAPPDHPLRQLAALVGSGVERTGSQGTGFQGTSPGTSSP